MSLADDRGSCHAECGATIGDRTPARGGSHGASSSMVGWSSTTRGSVGPRTNLSRSKPTARGAPAGSRTPQCGMLRTGQGRSGRRSLDPRRPCCRRSVREPEASVIGMCSLLKPTRQSTLLPYPQARSYGDRGSMRANWARVAWPTPSVDSAGPAAFGLVTAAAAPMSAAPRDPQHHTGAAAAVANLPRAAALPPSSAGSSSQPRPVADDTLQSAPRAAASAEPTISGAQSGVAPGDNVCADRRRAAARRRPVRRRRAVR